MKVFCNPLNVPYPYSFKRDPRDGYRMTVNREAADPSLVLFKGKYYLFASMTASVWVSEDLCQWESEPLPDNMPVYDYAPDVRVLGDWLYFTASNRSVPCDFYRTKDPVKGPYEKIPGSFDFWDPNLFLDDDGRLYFYWGCANATPIWGVELDRETMHPIGNKHELIWGDPYHNGYERFGDDHCENPRSEEEIEALFQKHLKKTGVRETELENRAMLRATFAGMPYIEGAWMTKNEGAYYLQYACPGAELNVYADGVYIGDSPLGPFRLAENNPYSYKPGGFLPGAGHGSTMEDSVGAWWHTATMRISVNHVFERRVGLWPAGFDMDGELFCNQRYGDWPLDTDKLRRDPLSEPDWMLLSYNKRMTASSFEAGKEPERAVDENVQTWWRAASASGGEWLCVDLGESMTVNAVQLNFADDPAAEIPCPGALVPGPDMERYIDRDHKPLRWLLEGSADGDIWTVIKDKRETATDLPHDLIVLELPLSLRFLRLTVTAVPYGVAPSVSGLRVFGKGNGKKPPQPNVRLQRLGDLDFSVNIPESVETLGFNILWGHCPDKLYHSYLVMADHLDSKRVGAVIKGRETWVRVDSFNENGITHGKVMKL
ncbi:MAG: family 43 glycosylhydrolase [Oscillospiraceae bacterium]|nr:family 43 glycosylhydrolase [Oscillospiraceae bacterium]